MANLVYSAITSLDGYVVDDDGKFDWAEPDEEVHSFVNDLERRVGSYLYGRRMYEVMVAWETMPLDGQPPFIREYAEIWRAAAKIVYSRTLDRVSSQKTPLERAFDADAVRRMKASTGRDMSVGGPTLAAQAIEAGLVDEFRFLTCPLLVGGGTRALFSSARVPLELVDERRFAHGVVHPHYRVRM